MRQTAGKKRAELDEVLDTYALFLELPRAGTCLVRGLGRIVGPRDLTLLLLILFG